jgi:hypothetical protein
MWDKEILEQCGCWFTDTGECIKDDLNLNKFARVIIEKEREACAKEADKRLYDYTMLLSNPPQNGAAWSIANAIRARGEA